MKVGLLFGGNSYEHDVSIITAKIISKKLQEFHDISLLYVDYDGKFYLIKNLFTDDIKAHAKSISFVFKGIKKGFVKQKLDVLISLMHGNNGEDGLAYWLANFYSIPYVGTNGVSSGILMDKYYTYSILKQHNFLVVSSELLLKNATDYRLMEYPFIIKPVSSGSSIGINVVHNDEELQNKVNDSFKYSERLLIQSYLPEFIELNQAAYIYNENIVVSRVEQVDKNEDILSFNDKYIQAKISKNRKFINDTNVINMVSEVTQSLYKLFELSGVVRFDYMLVGDRLYINEVNTTPGSLAYYLFDIPFDVFINELIYEALKEHALSKKKCFESDILAQHTSLKVE